MTHEISQQQPNGAKQDPERVLYVTRKGLAEVLQAQVPFLGKFIGNAALDVLKNGLQRGGGLLAGDARLQACQQVHLAFSLHSLPPVKDVGQVNVGATPHKARRHHPDHRAKFVVEPQFAADCIGISTELPLPELVSEHRHRLGAGRRVLGRSGPAGQRRHAHHLERVHGAVIAAQALRFALSRPSDIRPGGRDHTFEDSVSLGDVQKLVDVVVAAVPAPLALDGDAHQPVWVLVRERVQNHGIDHAVHGGAAAYAKRQRANRNGGKRTSLGKVPQAEADVRQKLLQDARDSHWLSCLWFDGAVPIIVSRRFLR